MIIDSLKAYFSACPFTGGAKVNVDFLDKTPLSFSINPEQCEPMIKKYACGGCMKQYCFTLAVRVGYDAGYDANFCEKLSSWIEEKNAKSELPELSGRRTAQRIEIIKSGYMFEEDIHTAAYGIGCRLIYTEDK